MIVFGCVKLVSQVIIKLVWDYVSGFSLLSAFSTFTGGSRAYSLREEYRESHEIITLTLIASRSNEQTATVLTYLLISVTC